MEIREGNLNYLENKHKKQPLINADKLEKLGWKCRLGIVEGFSRTITSFLKYGGGISYPRILRSLFSGYRFFYQAAVC